MVGHDALLAKVRKLEVLLSETREPGRMHQASHLAQSIASAAPAGYIAELAQRVATAVCLNAAPESGADFMLAVHTMVTSLRRAVEQEIPVD